MKRLATASRLYQASASCAQAALLGYVNACDVYGNCTTNLNDIPELPEVFSHDAMLFEGIPSVTLMVALNQTRTWDVAVSYWTSDGSAHAPDDYTAITTRTLVIPAGEFARPIVVPLNDDTLFEAVETFSVQFGNPINAELVRSVSTFTILDNDQPPAPFTENVALDEDAGTAIITITLDAISALDTTFNYATVPGSAQSPADYTGISGSATVVAGSSTFTLSVPIVDDGFDEVDESFTISLTNPTSATITTSSVPVTILDDDRCAVYRSAMQRRQRRRWVQLPSRLHWMQ